MSPELETELLDVMKADDFIKFTELIHEVDLNSLSVLHKSLYLSCTNSKHSKYLKALLEYGVHPNTLLLHRSSTMPALHVAASSNNPTALTILLHNASTLVNEVDDTKRTALHHGVIPRKDVLLDQANRCVQLLLSDSSISDVQHLTGSDVALIQRSKIDVDAVDMYGCTALHYAAKYGDHEMVLTLLRKGANMGVKDRAGLTPLLDIGPSTLEVFLDECLRTKNAKSPHEYMYTLSFSFPFLPSTHNHTRTACNSGKADIISCHKEQSSYTFSTEMETLGEISQLKDTRKLLKHPVITLFLNIKWHKIKAIFYFDICFYVVFLALLNFYIIERQSGACRTAKYITTNSTLRNTSDQIIPCGIHHILFQIFLAFALALLVLREVTRFIISSKKHILTPGNSVKLILTLFTITSISMPACDARQHVSALTILISWFELFLLTGNLPTLSIQLEMLKTVSFTFLRFMIWYTILILGFSFSFCILLDNGKHYEEGTVHSFFLDPARSFFKTIIMMAGEFDAVDVPLSSYPVTSHLVFLTFVFLIAIVLLNLLNGLAVSDTHAIRIEAEVYSLVSQVRTISEIEASLLNLQASHFFKWFSKLPCIKLLFRNMFIFPFLSDKKEISVYPNWKKHNVVINRSNVANEYIHIINWSFKNTLSNAIHILINKKKASNTNAVKMYLELKEALMDIHKMLDSFEK